MIRKKLGTTRNGEDLVLTVTAIGVDDCARLARHLERGPVDIAKLGHASIAGLRERLGLTSWRALSRKLGL